MAKVLLEIELDVRGNFVKGDHSVGEGDGFEDIEIEGAWIVTREATHTMLPGVPKYVEKKTGILNHIPVELRNTILETLDQTELQDTLREDLE